jgi:outer membrane lipoprotein carrier protein
MKFQLKLSRRSLLIARCLALGLPVFAAWRSPFAQDDLAATIAALQRRYAAVDSIRADFTQTYRAPGVDQIESGVVYMRKPGLMRWEYQTPEVKLFVADGRDTYLYTPEDRQVLVQRFTLDDLRSTPIQLLLGRGDIRRNYDVAREPASGARFAGTVLLRLTPRAGGVEYAYVLLECDKDSYDLRRIVIQERTGNTSEFLFSNLTTNGKVDSKLFQFKIPKGVEVVRLDAK